MDKKIERKRFTKTKIAAGFAGIGILALLFFGWKAINKKTYYVDASKITVKEVLNKEFKDVILVDGLVEPIKSVIVNVPEGGNVKAVFVEDGAFVKKGEPLLQLSNPGLMLSYVTQETAIVEQMNNLRNLKLSLEREERNLTESLIDIEFELQKSERLLNKDASLHKIGNLAKNDFKTTEELHAYNLEKQAFLKDKVDKASLNNQDQISRINASMQLMERNLKIIHENMERLLVKAPVSGRISSFNPVLGAAFNNNETIAKIDVLEGYKIKGMVDEYYLNVVQPNKFARYSSNNELVELKIRKVLPEVVNGKFGVEMEFTDKTPETIANGQSLQIRLELSEAKMANQIPKGKYYQSSGGRYVFVLNDKNQAEKRFINIGRQNPLFYEVVEGLSEGEKIITSSYEAFKDFNIIELKN